ncbi:MAG: M1 family metallopeptidase, partial [Ferruginibacter sp.]
MKKIVAILILLYCQLSTANCQSTYWQQQVNYKIDVTLNDIENTLDGYVKMDYYNNSPDTLHFIWIHLWPNAYKNDRTAFTDQVLENGSTDFYFSDNDKRGYINRLDFKVNGVTAKMEDHPQHQDIIRVMLEQPLAPHSSCKIETPFHVKLPYLFSRSGHVDQSYQIAQWYPKPAVYDSKGWHEIPYLDQGEFYSEFGNYEVQISLPKNYIVAATGELQSGENAAVNNNIFTGPGKNKKDKNKNIQATKKRTDIPLSDKEIKTLVYKQDHVHDFAWFADKRFMVKRDVITLKSGRKINAAAYFLPAESDHWSRSMSFIKNAILTKSDWLGEYPYNTVSVVQSPKPGNGGMEYPTITLISTTADEKSLDYVINHEVGHNWLYGILASNERLHPWMDEGMNTYYDNRYAMQYYDNANLDIVQPKSQKIKNKLPDDYPKMLLNTVTEIKKDQPIETAAENFNEFNYNIIAYFKTGFWMKQLEDEMGKNMFDSCMHEYFRRWQFKHPYPEDFKKVLEEVSGHNLDAVFSLLNQKGSLTKEKIKKDIRLTAFFNLKETDRHQYISVAPAIGYNFYDKLMLGLFIHDYQLPLPKLEFVAAPMYSGTSKSFNWLGRVGYNWYPGNNGRHIELAVGGESFNTNIYIDSTLKKNYLRFTKLVPSLKYVFANKDPRSKITKFIQWKTFLIKETQLHFERDTSNQFDIISYPEKSRYLNQLRFLVENHRVLYPYRAELQAEQAKDFVRLTFEGNYFFNYAKGGGMNIRFFAGKFFYLGDKTFTKQFETDPYQLNMTGPKGYEDYTYSNYYVGRNEFKGLSDQQIMIRGGGFKVRSDYLSSKIGKTDDWLSAANFTTSIPDKINPLSLLPFKLSVKIFADIGTYAEAWKKNAQTGRFIYDAGVQVSFFKDVLNIYIPLLYSKVYRDYFLSTIPEGRFAKVISFSIDVQRFNLRKL